MIKRIFAVALVLLLVGTVSIQAQQRNMLPRFPELIIEKGLSESFEVSECAAKVSISGNDADSTLKVTIKNKADKPVSSSMKFRILYPAGESHVRIRVDGKSVRFDRTSPRHTFELQPGAMINFEISARTSVNYSVDSVRKALREQEDKIKRKKGFLMEDFSRLFEREKFGRRFMIGPLVSKWGLFPVDFIKSSIEVSVPSEFVMVSPNAEIWKESHSGNTRVFKSEALENFAAAVFLPEGDREDFIQTQQVLTSENFMH
ncbi:MAG: hypothetical protein CVV42_09865 [Candidatus Riflebacteria bacterium HGW-Riflebacteria-2]|jgi:hypothetical protein|nr:MAG: hypothetical protein CVV42_09865 [Candidatus Riflebacteria bacterium HGW-Riflebacteria-2]